MIDAHALPRSEKTTCTVVYFIQAMSTSTQGDNKGEPITVYVGEWRGMTDGGRPAWSQCGPKHYPSRDYAEEIIASLVPYLPTTMWGFEGVSHIRIRKRTVTTTVIEEDACTSEENDSGPR